MAGGLRVVVDGPAAGDRNMAVDRVLLDAACAGRASLRLYGWAGSWLSLGYAQELEPGRAAACRRAGVAWVRRPTGGGAVLHGRDLTYAVALPAALLPRALGDAYGVLADALVEALAGVGVATTRREAPAGPRGFDCFASPAGHELCAGGRKLVGSAQRRVAGGVLQHGSIRLAPDPPEATAAAGLDPRSAVGLEELGWSGDLGALRGALAGAFAARLGLEARPASLDPAEQEAAAALAGDFPTDSGKPSRAAGLAISRAPSFRR